MLIADVANAGALPILDRTLAFAGARQRLLAHNIANLDTPDFRPMDVSTRDFQRSLAKAARERRERTGGEHGELAFGGTPEIGVDARGRLTLSPETPSGNVLYHDRNNRDVERMMQDLAENTLVFRVTTDLIRRQNDLLRTAISQRV